CKANKSNPIRLHYRFYADLVRINAKRSVRKKPAVGLERDFAREVLLLLEQNRILAVPNDFLGIYKPSIDLIQDLWLANVSSEDQPANLLLDR
ncbi:hypothetical protein, partial [Limnobacter sp.]|uniref:hypothetical protein n=1 Tax=Limnobacter sp. TaxID=2003368 RepID=UPI0025860FD3